MTGTTSWSEGHLSRGEVTQTTRRVAGLARENPLGLGHRRGRVGVPGRLVVPSTRVEDERLGRVSDQVMDKVKETGQEALDRGRQVAREVASTATETANEKTQEQGQGAGRHRLVARPGRPRDTPGQQWAVVA